MVRKKQLPQDETLKEKILQANVMVHRQEAQYYELLHPEVYSKKEQTRITSKLQMIDGLVTDNKKNALDVGAGTGNLTGKLLKMSYKVTAVDISPEMCTILKTKYSSYLKAGKLTVINSPIDNLSFNAGTFDLITGYSVLHHLPDYLTALGTLSVFLKKGGVIYIDHEASSFLWKSESSTLANFVKGIYLSFKPHNQHFVLSNHWIKRSPNRLYPVRLLAQKRTLNRPPKNRANIQKKSL